MTCVDRLVSKNIIQFLFLDANGIKRIPSVIIVIINVLIKEKSIPLIFSSLSIDLSSLYLPEETS